MEGSVNLIRCVLRFFSTEIHVSHPSDSAGIDLYLIKIIPIQSSQQFIPFSRVGVRISLFVLYSRARTVKCVIAIEFCNCQRIAAGAPATFLAGLITISTGASSSSSQDMPTRQSRIVIAIRIRMTIYRLFRLTQI